ncbi:GFA family protein [Enterovibrio norvegicus]|uniref:GFA family protein n=1 Tax=Enterovibrio norvegicus TaxID=188144 RepID=UPI000C814EA7
MHSGSCLCGQVKYHITGDIGEIVHCHCRTCQKAHAAAFSSVASVKDTDFEVVSGTLKSYESSLGKSRYFCKNCGSQIYAKREHTQHIILRLGTLDTVPTSEQRNHIWVSHQAPWYTFSDDLPKHEAFE